MLGTEEERRRTHDAVSRMEAMRDGDAWHLSANSFATGPATTMATVLFAVKRLTATASRPTANSHERGPRTSRDVLFMNHAMPPFSRMVASSPPARMATISVSLMPSVPLPRRSSAAQNVKRPHRMPIAAARTVPAKRSIITFSPRSARTRIRMYGSTSTASCQASARATGIETAASPPPNRQ